MILARFRDALITCLFLVLMVPVSHAQVDTSQFYTFGDSLTDNDLLFNFFGTPPEIYGADPAEAMFLKAAQPGDQLINFAVLGSTSAEVLAQVRSYEQGRRAGSLPAASLVSLQAGGNDFLDIQNLSANLFLLTAFAPGENEMADQVVRDAQQNLQRCMQILQRGDRLQIVLWTAPDISLTPYVLSFGFNAEELSNLRAHIARLNRYLRATGRRSNTAVLDSSALLTHLTWQPPQILGVTIDPTPAFGYATAQFADPIHPTAVVNGMVANEMIYQLNLAFHDAIPFYSELELGEMAGLFP